MSVSVVNSNVLKPDKSRMDAPQPRFTIFASCRNEKKTHYSDILIKGKSITLRPIHSATSRILLLQRRWPTEFSFKNFKKIWPLFAKILHIVWWGILFWATL